MSDEAREAAWRAYLDVQMQKRTDRDRGPFVPPAPSRTDWGAGFDAGVAEGIRQAREAVAGGGPWLVYDDRHVALAAIDALAE